MNMKKYKVVFIKSAKVIGPANNIIQLAEQIIESETDKLKISIPDGYGIVSVTEYLTDQKINSDDK